MARPTCFNLGVPGYEKTIVCLANSRKPSRRCLAGKTYENGRVGEWVRPVSSRPNQEISNCDREYDVAGRMEGVLQRGASPKISDLEDRSANMG